MPVFSFDAWKHRNDDDALRDAWLATRHFAGSTDWEGFTAECSLCGEHHPFQLPVECREQKDPNFRELLLCTHCGSNSRVRAALSLLRARLDFGSRPRVYITEQASGNFIWMQKHLPVELLGGEYEKDPERLAMLSRCLKEMGGEGTVTFRDVTALDFATGELDAITSFDVLEHVPDYNQALREFARTLRPGGTCVATFPFTDAPETIVRARVDAAGEIEHLLPAEYHGDPLGGGILCYYHFGWDILDAFRDAGFNSASMQMPYSLEQGLPYGLWTLVATR